MNAARTLKNRIRVLADAYGVDPFDVSIEKLKSHCSIFEREPQSRFWFRSPCYHVRTIDFTCHRVVPAMLIEKYPNLALKLAETSPRWGHDLHVPTA